MDGGRLGSMTSWHMGVIGNPRQDKPGLDAGEIECRISTAR